ncbi:hypothetical protein [Sabulibacter ruber]|uniref:hypothetical protein n=1 Tax=Sabulibacter ruber TaxID=2811901 RepID=UPI001A9790A3|nr:hypothetical protein [Sabulibacter ruber]
MTAKELKDEIQKALDTVPEDRLEDVLAYVREVQRKSQPEFGNSEHLEKILSEDKELLKKLAQ